MQHHTAAITQHLLHTRPTTSPPTTSDGGYIRFFGRPPLFSTVLETGRRRGNSYCRGAAAKLDGIDELLASLLTDSVSTSVLPPKGDM